MELEPFQVSASVKGRHFLLFLLLVDAHEHFFVKRLHSSHFPFFLVTWLDIIRRGIVEELKVGVSINISVSVLFSIDIELLLFSYHYFLRIHCQFHALLVYKLFHKLPLRGNRYCIWRHQQWKWLEPFIQKIMTLYLWQCCSRLWIWI